MTYVPSILQGAASIAHMMSAAYESRNFVLARAYYPVAKFQGDTSQTLTDGTLNVDTGADPSSAAKLATASNIDGTGNSTGKPMEVRVKRHSITAEVLGYAFFNADGGQPGNDDPWDTTANSGARYLVNIANGEIYVNDNANMDDIDSDADGVYESTADTEGTGHVVGLLEFKALEGGALTAMQQQASELSTVIGSLAALIRSRGETERSILSVIR